MPLSPQVLPGRAYQQVDRKSRLLFHWRAADLSLDPLTKEAPTFVRATGGGMTRDVNGNLGDYAQYQPRFEMSDLATAGVYDTPGLLIEGQRTNVVLQSQNFGASWAAIGTPTRTAAAVKVGALELDLIGDDDAAALEGYQQAIVFASNGTKVVSFYVMAGTSSSMMVDINDATAALIRGRVTVTFAAGVATAAASDGGVDLGVQKVNATLYRILLQVPGIVAANVNQLRIFPATNSSGLSTSTGNVNVGGVQAEDATFPSSYIKTTTAAANRNSDLLDYPLSFTPRDLTAYVKLARPVWAATPTSVSIPINTLLGVGDVSSLATNAFILYGLGGTGTRNWRANCNGSFADAAVPAGASLEVLGQAKNMTTGPQVAIDVGAGLGGFSAAVSAVTAFAGPRLRLGNISASEDPAYAAILEAKIAAGLLTMAQMREMF